MNGIQEVSGSIPLISNISNITHWNRNVSSSFSLFFELFTRIQIALKRTFETLECSEFFSYSRGAKMARIMKSTPRKSMVEQIFILYICSVTSKGVKDKTITTYKQHFHAISKRLDVSIPISTLGYCAVMQQSIN